MKKNWTLEGLHYILLFALIMGAWVFFMDMFGTGELPFVAFFTFIVFVIGDLLLHKYLLGEKL